MQIFDLGLDEDEALIADTFQSFFDNECPTSVVRAAEPLGFDRSLWSSLAQMEALAMGAVADHGGGGATMSQLVLVAKAMGTVVAPVPLVEHLVATRALGAAVTASELNGTTIAAFAPSAPGAGGGWPVVPGGAVADVVVGLVDGQLAAVRAPAPGVALANLAHAPIAPRSTNEGSVTVVGDRGAWERARAEWEVLTAAALVGLAERSLQLALQYVMARQQFGVPIGSFQAVQHGLASLPPMIEGARLLAHKAAWALDRHEPGEIDIDTNEITEPVVLAGMALVVAADAALTTTDHALHYHGGYGYSKEYDIQLYYRRARGWALSAGSTSARVRELADVLLPTGGLR